MPTIRRATPSDAKALAELAERTFREAFSDTNSTEDMDLHCTAYYGESLQSAELSDPDYVTFVAETDGQLIAYAQMRFGVPPACVPDTQAGEIQRLYVEQDWHGKGLAQQLMQTCLDTIHARAIDTAWLGVWEHNPRAIAFYRKFNFSECGEHVFVVGNDPQRDIIMKTSVARIHCQATR